MERETDVLNTKDKTQQIFEFYVENNRSEFVVFMALSLILWVAFYFTDRLILGDVPIADELMVRFLGFVFVSVVFYFMLNHAKTALVWDLAVTACSCMLCFAWSVLLLHSHSTMSPLYPSCSIAFIGVMNVFITRYIWINIIGMACVAGITGYVMHQKFSAAHPNIIIEFGILSFPLLLFFLVRTAQSFRRVDDIFDFHTNTRNQRKRLIRDNDKLREQASIDSLTGLSNRRAFEALHVSLMAQKSPFGLLLVSVDYFKLINEGYGHSVGDDVIVKVAHTLRTTLPDSATLFRLGGEEFVILVEGGDTSALNALAETLVLAVKNLYIPHKTRPDAIGVVTVSVGGALCDPSDTRGLKAHLETADRNVFDAKSKGRNTFVV